MTNRVVLYHSAEWNDLVEQGWITAFVEGRLAFMLYAGRGVRYAQ